MINSLTLIESKAMRVLHVLNELKPSGAETMLKSAAPYWHEHGVECEILATGASIGLYAEALRNAGYTVHHLPSTKRLSYFLRYRQFVRDGRYDVVHQHVEGLGYWFGLATILAGARLVRTIHSNFLFTGSLRWRRTLQRKNLKAMGARFVAIAPGVRENERSRFGIKSDLVLNWIDTHHFKPITTEERCTARSRRGFVDAEIVLVTVGNCAEVKNHTALIDAISKLSPQLRVRYLHAGIEDKDCTERRHCQSLGLPPDQVVFAGWAPDAREPLAAADIFVMPSKVEGFGIAAVEALGVGLPALLADVSGLRDLKNVYPNLLYAEPNAESLAAALRTYLARHPKSCCEFASDYAAITQHIFSPERGVREYCEIYS